ncbi:DUF2971 domain-containing protein [Microbulbifer sp. VTAC004]|uniref:DUF2971 domain-containing protein n=1 Tax=Microbulbifer sp. VTAC004 TaxID=3243386 RepID=UPI004039771B
MPEFDREKYLYHYTSMDTAINHILKNKTLLFNPLANVNDPMESDPNYWAFSSSGKFRDQLSDYFKNRIKTVCFSRDVQGDWEPGCCPSDFCARGHSKPRMWATYGDDNKGVCLIFDKELLRQAFENGLNGQGRLLHGAVRYGKQLPADKRKAAVTDLKVFEGNFEEALQKKIEDHHDIYFFYKHVDWSTEDEYRFVITGGEPRPIELAFDDALVGVVVGVKYMEKGDSVYDLGDIAQGLGVPGNYLSWGWESAGHAPINEAAKKIGPRFKPPL